jgi:hypothetical protein
MRSDAEMIARGEFFTEAELAAKPHLRRLARSPESTRTDPNNRPPSMEARKLAATPGVCAYCWEPADERSALNASAMHGECQEAWDAERQH